LPHTLLKPLVAAHFVTAAALALCCCQTEGDYFFLERNGAVMPIWVRGNVASGTFVLLVNGGPGDPSQTYIYTEAFKKLEARYGIVYWDQRGAGTSQGEPTKETFTVDEVVKDTDAVVTLLRSRYGDRLQRFFVLGHSWGGFLGTAWLLDPNHQAGVNGYIMMDGSFDFVHLYDRGRQFVLRSARQKVADGVEVEKWQAAIDWASQPNLPEASEAWAEADLETLGGYSWDLTAEWNALPPVDGAFVLLSPFNPFTYLRNASLAETPGRYDWPSLLRQNLTSAMSSIRVPTLITWGRHDPVPFDFAQQAYDALGTDPALKSVRVFENSGHVPAFQEAGPWSEAVSAFIDGAP
jgi:proline iminopeptidase